jgi:hypothetical protein
MTGPVAQTVHSEVSFDLRAVEYREDDGIHHDRHELNEFTIADRTYDLVKLHAFFKGHVKAAEKVQAVWQFMEGIGTDEADADNWEDVE